MSSKEGRESKRDEENSSTAITPRRFENIFDNFRRDMERMMRPWPLAMNWPDMPSLFEARDMRLALYDLVDKGDRYELQVEVPGIEKEKIDVKATRYTVEVSGKHSEKTEEKGKRYLYTERLYRSFYRNVPVPEEIVPSKVSAKVESGILKLELPKKVPTRGEDETKVDVK
ncbi:Hsp20/alpha crystallin family protein [Nitrososphaera viennensis]|uniref:Hsp20/alpha crystallin family protein n=2 Tax=Nitrososphaera viennensis TaxID=1034015 RepID=A0A977IEA0_9ARCH|nr:Hsp20/alpha crystallin family protein [Nitrososphaera viennensis]AIC14471.1 putative heat-shock protein Hsp20 [Nitrososphaera viennensis EN76]UVS69451.1 Hsp20/alpha crystallin family protein [Nitrososphaera viennensis]